MTVLALPLPAIAFPAIDPILVEIGPLAIRWYALAYIVGLVLGWLLARRLAARDQVWGGASPITPQDLDDVLFWTTLGVIVGGRLGYVLFYNPAYFAAHPGDILAVWKGGMSFHGGLMGTIVALVLVARARAIPVLSLFDIAGVVAPIGLFFGRIANFINSELWGRPADVPWAVIFPNGGGVPRHPSQLYEATLEGILLLAIMLWLVKAGGLRRPGLAAGVFGIGYGLARITAEFFREPDVQLGYLAFGTTMGMWLSFPLVLAGFALMVNALTRPERT